MNGKNVIFLLLLWPLKNPLKIIDKYLYNAEWPVASDQSHTIKHD